jgi:hypothetical protein
MVTVTDSDAADMLEQLRMARERFERGLFLLERATELLEMLWWGLDLDDMRAEVNLFLYACKAHRWERSAQ